MTFAAPTGRVGSPDLLTWSSTDAKDCIGSDGLTGALQSSGSSAITPSAGGNFKYTITCSGDGGSVSKTASLTVPMPVYKTSYENKNNIALDNPTIPEVYGVPGIVLEPGEQGFSQRAVAFADFSQNGSFDTAITFSSIYKGVDTDGSNPNHWSDSPSKMYFLQKNTAGVWSDVTSKLVKDMSTRACVSPGFLSVGDFNNDGKPDVLISCTGPDYVIVSKNNTFQDLSDQFIVLSQPDNTYKLVKLPIAPIYSHQSTIADVDGDGNADIITVNTHQGQRPFVMFGHGDGTFRADYNAFPVDTQDKSIYGIVGVPVDGKMNFLLSGYPPGSEDTTTGYSYGTKVLQYVNGSFQYVADLTSGIPKYAKTGQVYSLNFDAIYKDGFYYTIRVANQYAGEAVIKVNAATGASTILYERDSGAGSGAGSSGSLKLTSGAKLVNYMADCNTDIAPNNFFYVACKMSVPVN